MCLFLQGVDGDHEHDANEADLILPDGTEGNGSTRPEAPDGAVEESLCRRFALRKSFVDDSPFANLLSTIRPSQIFCRRFALRKSFVEVPVG